jgi:hypothetical protein
MTEMGVAVCSTYKKGFSFPTGYVEEVKARFPDVEPLHWALTEGDEGVVISLLNAYLIKLSINTPEQIVEAVEEVRLDELVDRAHQAIEFREFLNNLEKRYFPEKIRARVGANHLVLES